MILIAPYLLIGLLLIALGVFAAGASIPASVQFVLVPVLWLTGVTFPLSATLDYLKERREKRAARLDSRRQILADMQRRSNETNRSLGLPKVWRK